MKIALIGQKGMPAKFGGVERHVHELAVRLIKFGPEVTVYSRKWYTNSSDGNIEGVNIKHVPSINTKHLDTITHTLFSSIHAVTKKYDIIHYHGIGPSLLSWIPRLLSPQTKVITTFHSIDRKHAKWNWFAKLILKISEWTACKFAHDTITISRTIEQYSRDVYDKDTVYIPNGVPIYEKAKEANELEKWNIKPQEYIVMISRLIPHKGAHYLIEAYKNIIKDNSTNKKLVIVGDGYHTEDYVKQLKEFADNDPNIIFTGFQSEEALHQLFSHAYMMVHPSDNEGLPINVLEGMSYGLPILLSNIPEHRELMTSPKYLFKYGNVNSLIEQLTQLLKSDPNELRQQGMKNREKIKEEYNWDSLVVDILNVYQDRHFEEVAEAISLVD